MQEQDSIDISIESNIKRIAEAIFEKFGMTKSEAIELFYRQVAMTQDIPFIQRNLNETTHKAIEDVNNKSDLTSHDSFAELRQDVGV